MNRFVNRPAHNNPEIIRELKEWLEGVIQEETCYFFEEGEKEEDVKQLWNGVMQDQFKEIMERLKALKWDKKAIQELASDRDYIEAVRERLRDAYAEEIENRRGQINAFPITVCDQWLFEKISGANMLFSLFPACLSDIQRAKGTTEEKYHLIRYFKWIDLLMECRPIHIRVELTNLVAEYIVKYDWAARQSIKRSDSEMKIDPYEISGIDPDESMLQFMEREIHIANRMYAIGRSVYKEGGYKVSLPDPGTPYKAVRELFFNKPGYQKIKQYIPANQEKSTLTNSDQLFAVLLYQSIVRAYELNNAEPRFLSENYENWVGHIISIPMMKDLHLWFSRHHQSADAPFA